MGRYSFSNIDITNEYISADVYDNQQYMMRITNHILHIKYIELNNELYKQFQQVARFHLSDYDGPPEDDILQKLKAGLAVTHGKENGQGIGFTQLRNMVANLSGDLDIESKLGGGPINSIWKY